MSVDDVIVDDLGHQHGFINKRVKNESPVWTINSEKSLTIIEPDKKH